MDKKNEAKKMFFTGVERYKEGKYSLALEAFKESYDMRPHWQIHFNIGLCYKDLGFFVKAKREFESYLSKGKSRISKKMKVKIAEVLEEIASVIEELTVRVNVTGAEIIVDGYAAGFSPLASGVELGRGEHVLEVVRDGYERYRTTFFMEPGEAKTIDVFLAKIESGTGDTQPTEGRAAGKAKKKRTLPWVAGVGLGLGVGLLGASLYTGIETLDLKSEFDGVLNDYDSETATWEDYENAKASRDSLKQDGELYGLLTTVFLCSGAVLTVASAVLLIVDWKLSGKGESRIKARPSGGASVAIVPSLVLERHGASAGITLRY
ncbi:MAG: PEGA domain-containing protein [Pseudomonadota bacterium]